MNKKSLQLLIVLTIPFLLYQNCGKPSDLQYSSTFDLSSQLGAQESSLLILQKNCSECHSDSVVSGNVGDITDLEYLIYSRLIIPGEPEISPIITQVTQGQMPVGKPALSSAEVEALKTWIKGLNQQDTGGGVVTAPTIEAKYSALASQIFGPRCVTCHAGRNYKLNSYTEIMRIVTAGNSANSLLYQVVTVGANGGRMPQGGGLSSAQIKAIQDWINAGAMNN